MDNSEQVKVDERREPKEPNTQAGQSADDPTVRTGEEPVTGPAAPESE
jgi:hypothetical protein